MVEHLDDLLLRRTRLGMLLPDAGMTVMDQVKALTQGELRWTEDHWQSESPVTSRSTARLTVRNRKIFV
jgi:glycerol-3-phosphate dehydrogenase